MKSQLLISAYRFVAIHGEAFGRSGLFERATVHVSIIQGTSIHTPTSSAAQRCQATEFAHQ